MARVFPAMGKRTWIVLITLFLIFGVFSYYFFGYVADNEHRYIQRSYRILNRISENTSDRAEALKNSLKIFFQNNQQELREISKNFQSKDLDQKIERVYESLIADNISGSKYDSLNKAYNQLTARASNLREAYNQGVDQIIGNDLSREITLYSYYSYKDSGSYYNDQLSYGDQYFSDPVINLYLEEDQYSASYGLNLETFLSPVLNNDFFDQYIIIGNQEQYNAEEDKIEARLKIQYQSFPNEITLESMRQSIRPYSDDFTNEPAIDPSLVDKLPNLKAPVEIRLYEEDYLLVMQKVTLKDKFTKYDYYIGGFISRDKFNNEIRRVEPYIIIISLLILLIAIISMPILKLVLMSSIERLHIKNVMMVAGSIIIGLPILLIIIYSMYDFLVAENNRVSEDLRSLSNDIESSFENELMQILHTLDFHDTVLQKGQDTTLASGEYTHMNYLFWIDSLAKLSQHKTPFNEYLTEGISLNKRDYYQKIKKHETWEFVEPTGEKHEFYMESIISWSDFTNEAAISKASQSSTYEVVALTTRLTSVMNTILPTGYGFAVIDQEGEVLFHSNKDKNLQENFLQEINQNNVIKTAMFSRIKAMTTLKYNNRHHLAQIAPINHMPLYLVTFYDRQFQNERAQGIISLSLILMMGSFGIIVFIVGLYSLMQRGQSKLRIKSFLFHWIKPNDEHPEIYLRLIFIFMIIGIVLIGFGFHDLFYFQDLLFLFVVTNGYLFVISYHKLRKYTLRTPKGESNTFFISSILISMALINVIYFGTFYFGRSENFDQSPMIWLLLYQLVLILFAFSFLEAKKGSGALARLRKDLLSKRSVRVIGRYTFFPIYRMITNHAYNVFLFCWIILSGVIPISFVFTMAHDSENEVWAKYNQLELARNFEDKVLRTNKSFDSFSSESIKNRFVEAKVTEGNYFQDIHFLSCQADFDTQEGFHQNRRAFNAALFYIRPVFGHLMEQGKGLVYDQRESGLYRWLKHPNGDLELFYRSTLNVPEDYASFGFIKSISKVDLFKDGHHERSVAFLLFVLFLLFMIYKIISYCTNKIYAREYSSFKNTLPLEIANFKKLSTKHLLPHKQRQIFLLGLPKSNKSNLIKTVSKDFYEIDLLKMNDEEEWTKIINQKYEEVAGVIIENFEYEITSHISNMKRLKLMEKLVTKGFKQLLISSNVHPSVLLDFYENKLDEDLSSDDRMMFSSTLETWRHLFNGFIIIHNPIKENHEIDAMLNDGWISDQTLISLLKQELNRGNFLPQLLPGIKDYIIKQKEILGDEVYIDKEDVIIRIQMLAESYYLGLWNTLTKREKYIIYDLAKDRFVNVNNNNGIRNLLEKGLLVYDNELRIMNESFSNFVLSVIKTKEALLMEKEVREKGSWSIISSVIGLVLISLVAFLFVGNPDMFNNINALLGVLAAFIGFIPKLTGLIRLKGPAKVD